MSHSAGWPENKVSTGNLTERDLQLGKRALRIGDIICVAGILACMAIAVYVFQGVPLDTRLSEAPPSSGRSSGARLPAPIVVGLVPLLLTLFWRVGKTPKAHRMDKGARIRSFVLTLSVTVAFVVGQCILARGLLVAGGALPG